MTAYRTPGPGGHYTLPLSPSDNGRQSKVVPAFGKQAFLETVPVLHGNENLAALLSGMREQNVIKEDYAFLDPDVINAACFHRASRKHMEEGARPRAIVRLRAGTALYRIGSTVASATSSFHSSGEEERNKLTERNYTSPWWLRRQELERILAKGQQDTSWAGRIMLAIASVWGSRCDLQISVVTVRDLYAWVGEPNSIDELGKPVSDTDPDAYWIPEKDLMQLYIPGLREQQRWRSVFQNCSATAWLWAGDQVNLVTGERFIPAHSKEKTLPPGKR